MNFILLSALLIQEEPCEPVTHCCNDGRDAKPWALMNRGVHWEATPEAAMERAAREKKTVMLFQLVGDLDREGC